MQGTAVVLYRSLSTFVQNDIDLLSERYKVVPLHYRSALSLLHLARAVRAADLTFSWFASRYAAAAVMLGRRFGTPSAVVAGGYDAANVPAIGYGMSTRPLLGRIPRYCFENADLVLPVSDATAREVAAMATPRAMVRVYNGVRTGDFVPRGTKEGDLVLTVGNVDRTTVVKKGIGAFVAAAGHLPDLRFVVVGDHADNAIDALKREASENVTFTGRVPFAELLSYYQRAVVYVQPSVHESFGVSVAEAMLCRCVPVVTGNAALPEVAGPSGVVIPNGTPEAIAAGIEEARASGNGPACRARALENFSLERRRKELFAALDEHLGL